MKWNVVAAIGQFDSQLRGDYAAAAIGRITGDADFHMRSLPALIDASQRVPAAIFLPFIGARCPGITDRSR